MHLAPGAVFEAPLPAGHNAFVYVYEGEALVGDDKRALRQPRGRPAFRRRRRAGSWRSEKGAQLLVLAGKPLREPVVQYGPFVMNTREEIEQAIADYQSGEFARRAIATTL